MTGEIDITHRELLRSVFTEVLSQCGGGLVVDSTQVRFCGAALMGALITLRTDCAVLGVELRVLASPFARRVMGLTGLSELLAQP
ncbi:STAS domain-containing protein [Amycolatopsis sp. lyj-23]|uniref:STAS domain-containing protein n=1 Tax=Amycolatopsis sp. lyj-23 TaxID=2789283 RepID=UPI00397C94EF